jgi:putative ABC transport system substrate-binding protein
VKRREFITLLGGAAALPVAAGAQAPPPAVIGTLSSGSADDSSQTLTALLDGLRDTGYVEGRNLVIEYRFAENHYDRLPLLAAELVRLKVAAIWTGGGGGAGPLAVKAATTSIPIVFQGGYDPVQSGLVTSLNRPGGNITGVSFANNVSESKRLGLLHAVVARAAAIGVLINPDNASAQAQLRDLNGAARALGLNLQIAHARYESDFEPAFAAFAKEMIGGLVVATDAFFTRRNQRLVTFAARYAIPAIYPALWNPRDAAAAGGLMSYGASIQDATRQAGVYVGRILHGERPGDLPVSLASKFELVINLKTAKALGIEVPPTLSAIADEVIE